MSIIINFFKKVFTHNYCDTCGFTKDNVFCSELRIEAGIIQCKKCKINYGKDSSRFFS